jgi:polyamine oxidase
MPGCEHSDPQRLQRNQSHNLILQGNNFTYDTDQGGFSDINLMSLDQRGFKSLIQLEAAEFLKPQQSMLNATVKTISHSKDGVTVTLRDGHKLTADYVLCTFSLGVLQNDDIAFTPTLPGKLPLFIIIRGLLG